jgi:hypothetical protein
LPFKTCFWRFALFLSAFLFFSCRKVGSQNQSSAQAVKGKPEDSVASDSSYYTDITVNGQRSYYISGSSGCAMYYGDTGPFAYSGITSDSNIYAALGNYYNTSFLEFDKYNFPIHTGPSFGYIDSVFNSWVISNFLAGNYRYFSPDTVLTAGNAVALVWTDAVGVQWKTSAGSQPGIRFAISKGEPFYDSATGYIIGVNVSAAFACTLYNPAGQQMHLSNGRFRLAIWL